MKKIALSCAASVTLMFANTTANNLEQIEAQIKNKQTELQQLEAQKQELLKQAQNKVVEQANIQQSSPLKTRTELGYVKTSGNSENESFALDATLKKTWDKQTLEGTIDAKYATSDDVESQNRYTIELNYDYALSNRFSVDYLLGYSQDKFSGFDYRLYTGPGAKYALIKASKHQLSLNGNILYAQDKQEDIHYTATGEQIKYPNENNLVADPSKTVNGTTDEYASYRVGAQYDWNIIKDLTFSQNVTYRASFEDNDNYFVDSKSSLIQKLTDMMSVGLNYKIHYVNLPALGKVNSDKELMLNLIFDY
jgi:putative salt-induced outer membrane protein